jgi:hypothetical protein
LSNLALEFWTEKGIIDTEVKAEEFINPAFVKASK